MSACALLEGSKFACSVKLTTQVHCLLEKEIEAKSGSKRPASDTAGGLVKKPRPEVPRASWIEGSSLTAKRSDVGGNRGRGGGGGYRGGGAAHFNTGGGRGFFPRGRGGRGRFFPPHGRY